MKAFEQMWEVEPVKSDRGRRVIGPDQKQALDMMRISLRHDGVRYEVGIPWAVSPSKLPNNFSTALGRLHSQFKSLSRKPEIQEAYSKIIKQYQEKKFIREVEIRESENVWYLAHFAVVKGDRENNEGEIGVSWYFPP